MEMTGVIETIQAAMEGKLTVSPQPFDTSRMDQLMSRSDMTEAECEELRSLAMAMPVEHVAATQREFAKHLQFIRATLPTQYSDEESGQQRTAVYARILGGYTNAALSYMTERVCRELDWFPTPRQCLAILSDYKPPLSRKDKALYLYAAHTEARFDEWIAALRSGTVEQGQIDDKPERWRRIAETQGLLRLADGNYTQRAKA